MINLPNQSLSQIGLTQEIQSSCTLPYPRNNHNAVEFSTQTTTNDHQQTPLIRQRANRNLNSPTNSERPAIRRRRNNGAPAFQHRQSRTTLPLNPHSPNRRSASSRIRPNSVPNTAGLTDTVTTRICSAIERITNQIILLRQDIGLTRMGTTKILFDASKSLIDKFDRLIESNPNTRKLGILAIAKSEHVSTSLGLLLYYLYLTISRTT